MFAAKEELQNLLTGINPNKYQDDMVVLSYDPDFSVKSCYEKLIQVNEGVIFWPFAGACGGLEMK